MKGGTVGLRLGAVISLRDERAASLLFGFSKTLVVVMKLSSVLLDLRGHRGLKSAHNALDSVDARLLVLESRLHHASDCLQTLVELACMSGAFVGESLADLKLVMVRSDLALQIDNFATQVLVDLVTLSLLLFGCCALRHQLANLGFQT